MEDKKITISKTKEDVVNHPSHYMLEGLGIEVIDVIDEVIKNTEGITSHYLGTILGYLLRAEKKNGLEDYKKAKWYLDRLISKKEEEI